MGYILPIDHFQYNDYQKRIVQQKDNKHHIEGPFKVILNTQHEEISSKYDTMNKSSTENIQPHNASEALFGTLTGKGRNFSEQA
ncbi:hypothetical protein [Oceanobacillus damuensis]|uniref:hypothetical protein n=1 Tax=Oceanobacillus damuensis TaxID=937928 RepID=UPI000835EB28|nr:hypothetical protein [Oceanobacillus damuensis]